MHVEEKNTHGWKFEKPMKKATTSTKGQKLKKKTYINMILILLCIRHMQDFN